MHHTHAAAEWLKFVRWRASKCGLSVTAEDLQAQGDVVDPTPRVDTEVLSEQWRIKICESFLVWIFISCKNLKKPREK